MKPSQIAFNVVGLLFAALFLVSAVGAFFMMLPDVPVDKRVFWYYFIPYEALIALLLGGGGIGNFAKGRLAGWPTGCMIAGCCMTLLLIPLGIWGASMLQTELERRKDAAKAAPQG